MGAPSAAPAHLTLYVPHPESRLCSELARGSAIVGEPSGRYLWLLSRNPYPLPRDRDAIVARARALGYETHLIRPTEQ